MSKIVTHLTFNGNCREAMTFYHKCFGGTLRFQTVGESPLSENLPERMKDCILQATLSNRSILIMGSDMAPETGLINGNSVSLSVNCRSEEQAKKFYKKLSSGGKVNHPLMETYWGSLFSDLTDKFGNHWLLNCKREPGQKREKSIDDN